MHLGQISPPEGGVKKRKRVGCGPGSGHGKTACKGHKGQKARAGAKHRAWFEGGQMPIQRRLPKIGFKPLERKRYQIVNLSDAVERISDGPLTPDTLRAAGLIRDAGGRVKLLGDGQVGRAVEVRVHAISASASAKVSEAGGKVEIIS
ncbi:MAG: 50S ribosomal protein L15 [Candidatus Latescibacteria bacterium]|nr:50S ribosomal protein L15 [Candidatus Latescibacterota bacterium]